LRTRNLSAARQCDELCGKPRKAWQGLWILLFAAGVAAAVAQAVMSGPTPVLRALLVNFVFFTPLAAALVVWPATVMLSRGGWMGSVKQDGLAGIVMAPLSLAAFAVLWLGRAHWAAWLHEPNLPNRAWLDEPFLFARDGLALVVWWAVALGFVRKARNGRPKVLAGWVAFLYAVVFSLLAFDVVMALDAHWFSSLFGGYFFVTGLYAAIALLALRAAVRPGTDPDRLHDLGKLVVTFSIMTTYLMFSQLLPIWYENFPDEVRFVLPRLTVWPWARISAALLATVYLGPLILLLTVRAKKTPRVLGTVTLMVLAGLWVERWWLVMPTLDRAAHVGVADVSIGAAFVGALGWGLSRESTKAEVEGNG